MNDLHYLFVCFHSFIITLLCTIIKYKTFKIFFLNVPNSLYVHSNLLEQNFVSQYITSFIYKTYCPILFFQESETATHLHSLALSSLKKRCGCLFTSKYYVVMVLWPKQCINAYFIILKLYDKKLMYIFSSIKGEFGSTSPTRFAVRNL
jgi:hypothetical protein